MIVQYQQKIAGNCRQVRLVRCLSQKVPEGVGCTQ